MKNLIVGLLIGLVVALNAPAGAHHSRLATKVNRLLDRVVELEFETEQLRAADTTFTNKTRYLASDGLYHGYVVSRNCAHGADAVWLTVIEQPELSAVGCP